MIISPMKILLRRKIRLVTAGLSHQYSDHLYNKTQKENAMAIIDFILSMKTEINLSSHHIKNNIMALTVITIS